MRSEPELALDLGGPSAQHLLFVLLATATGLVSGMAAGIVLMSDLLPAVG